MPFLQEWIHKLEEGTWFRYLRIALGILAAVGLVVWYNARSFHNLNTAEGMDAAQVARNVAEGKGFTTYYIRPFSMYLVSKRTEAKTGVVAPNPSAESTQIKGMHPDLANPPGYPLVLAGLMKVLPFRYDVDLKRPFWSIPPLRQGNPRQFWRHEPDFIIAIFNQLLFYGVVVLTFFLARRLFDRAAAWTSAILLLGCEQLWRFSVSGLSTMMVLLIFMGLIWCMVWLEESLREAKGGDKRLLALAVTAGALVALGTLTRYSFGWLIIPVIVFLIVFGGTHRIVLCLAVLSVFVVLLLPWMYRNWSVSGTPFGTAGYALVEGTAGFSEGKLMRTLTPSFKGVSVWGFIYKFLNNSRQMLANDLPKLGGSWMAAFFVVGLLLGFRNLALRRLRYFLLGALVTLFVAQALGRTQLAEDAPDINAENQLVLVFPLVLMFGVGLFFMLLDQMTFVFQGLRYAVIGLFGVVICLPMIFTFFPPKPVPLAYPPYYPPILQQIGGWMKDDELMMSDIPWAVAWYGRQQCLSLTLNADTDFFAINDMVKPIRALYLTPQTMDNRFLSQWVRAGERSWGAFIIGFVARHEAPRNFPLRVAPEGYLPEQLIVTDWERWKKPAEVQPGAP